MSTPRTISYSWHRLWTLLWRISNYYFAKWITFFIPISNSPGGIEDDHENIEISVDKIENKINYSVNFKSVNEKMVDNNKKFENFVNLIDELPDSITSIRFSDIKEK